MRTFRPSTARARALRLALALAPCCGLGSGCATVPDAREVLARDSAPEGGADATADDVLARGRAALEEARGAALAALEVAQAADDPAPHAAAARALTVCADLTLQTTLVERFRARTPADPGELIHGEDDLPTEDKRAVEGLVRDAAEHAARALAARPGDLAARQDQAFAESLAAWAMGSTRALVSGAGRRLPKLLAANRAAGPLREDAAPTRLEGRFLCMAPWPVGDLARGRALLDEAAAAAPTALNALFQGDAAWLDGDRASAQTAWRTAADAGRASGSARDALVAELAEQRLGVAGTGR